MLKVSVCVSAVFKNSALAFTSCLCPSLKVSERLAFSMLTVLGICTFLHMWVIWDSQEQIWVFQDPLRASHSPNFPFKLFSFLLIVCPNLSLLLQATVMLYYCLWLLQQIPLRKRQLVQSKLLVRWNKTSAKVVYDSEPLDRSNNDLPWGIGFWRNSKFILSPPAVARLLVFRMSPSNWFLHILRSWGWE